MPLRTASTILCPTTEAFSNDAFGISINNFGMVIYAPLQVPQTELVLVSEHDLLSKHAPQSGDRESLRPVTKFQQSMCPTSNSDLSSPGPTPQPKANFQPVLLIQYDLNGSHNMVLILWVEKGTIVLELLEQFDFGHIFNPPRSQASFATDRRSRLLFSFSKRVG